MYTDTHCHLASDVFEGAERDLIVERAQQAGVSRMISLSTGRNDLINTMSWLDHYKGVYACLGLHPCEVTYISWDEFLQYKSHFTHPKVVGVGETGLDYYHAPPEGWDEMQYHALQRTVLEKHFELSKELGLNIVLHTRDRKGGASFDDCLEIYRHYADSVQAVFHCFPGHLDRAKRVLSCGGLLSFTGNMTFKNARKVREVVQSIPLDSFMLETDAPYLTPEPHRGSRNEPSYIPHIAECLYQLRAEDPTLIRKTLDATTTQFFKL